MLDNLITHLAFIDYRHCQSIMAKLLHAIADRYDDGMITQEEEAVRTLISLAASPSPSVQIPNPAFRPRTYNPNTLSNRLHTIADRYEATIATDDDVVDLIRAEAYAFEGVSD